MNGENARLAEELARARARQEDLTRSAELWIRLYETHLALAHARDHSVSAPAAGFVHD